jgi:hypothetical protein
MATRRRRPEATATWRSRSPTRAHRHAEEAVRGHVGTRPRVWSAWRGRFRCNVFNEGAPWPRSFVWSRRSKLEELVPPVLGVLADRPRAGARDPTGSGKSTLAAMIDRINQASGAPIRSKIRSVHSHKRSSISRHADTAASRPRCARHYLRTWCSSAKCDAGRWRRR